MKMKHSVIALSLLAMVAAGCGQKNAQPAGESFASGAAAAAGVNSAAVTPAAASPTPSLAPTPAAVAPSAPAETAAASSPAAPSAAPSASPAAASQPPSASPTAAAAAALPSVSPSVPPAASPSAAPTASPAPTPAPPASEPKQEAAPGEAPKQAGTASNEINWSQFFDNDKQDRPSEHFWDMNGKTVQIKGFMGEVLSFEKHWFLLIPKPGAECPFDNGDETYWNKIMIVYVPDDVKLRYTSGPLLITGKLDVGVKLDESGYKTMFRLYNASFEKIKE